VSGVAGHPLARAAGRVALIAVIGGTAALGAAPAAAAGVHIPNPITSLFGSCKSAPAPELPGSGVPGQIAGVPATLPPPGNPFARGSRTSEYEQYGFAGLTWHTYDLGCFHVFGLPDLDTWIGNGFLQAAEVIVAIDDAVHDWASTPGWIAALNPVVTAATRGIHKALFTPWAAVSLSLLALTLLVRACRAELASAVTMAAWALFVLALVAGVTAYPTWAARQISSLMASTINSMDAGFTGQSAEASAANGHSALLVSAVLYPQWVSGEMGSSTSAAARHYGPLLLENQALTWRQATGSQNQVAAIETAEQKRWSAVAGQIQSTDPALYPVLQGTLGSRIGTGALTLANAAVVCSFDIFASIMIVVALLAVLVATILLPALAVVGLHHGLRQVVTGVLSRVAGMLLSAVLYSAAAGVDIRASQFLLARQNTLVTGPGAVGLAQLPGAVFIVMFIQLALTIALFLAVRYAKTGRVIPRAVLYGGLLAADLALRRRVGRTAADAATDAAGDAPLTVINVLGGVGQQEGGDNWNWSATAEPRPPQPRALPPSAPRGGSGPQPSPPEHPGPGGDGRPQGGGPSGGAGGGGAGSSTSGPWYSGGGPGSPGSPPQPGPGPAGGTGGYYLGSSALGDQHGRSLTASQGPDGTWEVYRGSPHLGDDVPGAGPGRGQDSGDQ
jgi:uncharacterized membrane protein YgcG